MLFDPYKIIKTLVIQVEVIWQLMLKIFPSFERFTYISPLVPWKTFYVEANGGEFIFGWDHVHWKV